MARIPGATRAKYDEFIDEGSLHVMPGTILDVDGVIFDDLDAHIQECDYDARTFGYDAYGAKAFSEKWEQMNGVYGMERVIQGARTESVPLGELKNLSEERLLLFDELLMQYCMGNAVVEEDTNYNRKLMKKRYDEKIDNVSALMDAFVAWKLNKEMFE
jgi:phage terminase large subunit-like protein